MKSFDDLIPEVNLWFYVIFYIRCNPLCNYEIRRNRRWRKCGAGGL